MRTWIQIEGRGTLTPLPFCRIVLLDFLMRGYADVWRLVRRERPAVWRAVAFGPAIRLTFPRSPEVFRRLLLYPRAESSIFFGANLT